MQVEITGCQTTIFIAATVEKAKLRLLQNALDEQIHSWDRDNKFSVKLMGFIQVNKLNY